MDERASELRSAIDTFMARHDETAISASRPMDELLEIWSLASQIDPLVAAPVERLLSALVGRQLTSSRELAGAMEDVRRALARLPETADL